MLDCVCRLAIVKRLLKHDMTGQVSGTFVVADAESRSGVSLEGWTLDKAERLPSVPAGVSCPDSQLIRGQAVPLVECILQLAGKSANGEQANG